jgi:hypothetical protein
VHPNHYHPHRPAKERVHALPTTRALGPIAAGATPESQEALDPRDVSLFSADSRPLASSNFSAAARGCTEAPEERSPLVRRARSQLDGARAAGSWNFGAGKEGESLISLP